MTMKKFWTLHRLQLRAMQKVQLDPRKYLGFFEQVEIRF